MILTPKLKNLPTVHGRRTPPLTPSPRSVASLPRTCSQNIFCVFLEVRNHPPSTFEDQSTPLQIAFLSWGRGHCHWPLYQMRENRPQKSTLNMLNDIHGRPKDKGLTGHTGQISHPKLGCYTLNHYCVNILYPKRRLRYQKRPYYRYEL